MEVIKVNSINGLDPINVYEVSEFESLKYNLGTIQGKKTSFCESFGTFDIETSSIIKKRSERHYKRHGKKKEYYSKEEIEYCKGFMYIWQMCIDGKVFIGRKWEEFFQLIEKIVDKFNTDLTHRFVIYVHNLAYEFQFLLGFKEYFGGLDNVFAVGKRKPLKVICGNGIEFRCSMRLSNMSLDKFTNTELGVIHTKSKGDLDYSILRTCNTPLSETELGYCVNDVLGLYEAIIMRMKHFNHDLKTIPLTSTGYVRQDTREACFSYPYYKAMFNSNKMDEETYKLLREEYRGGNTHANRIYSGVVQESKNGQSFDIVSSYPFQMLRANYPMTKFYRYGTVDKLSELFELGRKRPFLVRCYFRNIHIKKNIPIPYISMSKCLYLDKEKPFLEDNGRVICSNGLILTINEIDLRIIYRQYNFDEIAIGDIFVSRFGKLPEPIRKTILKYYREKTELKIKIKEVEKKLEKKKDPVLVEKLEELKYLYAQAKARLNGIYGLAAQNPIKPEIKVNIQNNWIEEELNVDSALKEFYKKYSSFMVYSWACWITAYAREELDAFTSLHGKGIDCIYVDTDSCKCRVTPDGIEKIKKMNERIKKICDERGCFIDVNNKRYYLGLWDCETEDKPWLKFKSLGAKKYCYEDADGLHITISGVRKKDGVKELKTIDNFNLGFTFEDSAGNTLYYNNDPAEYITINGDTFLTGSNVGMCQTTYTLNQTGEYQDLLQLYRLEVN